MSRPDGSTQPAESTSLLQPAPAGGEAAAGTLYDGSPRRFRIAAVVLLALFAVLAVASVAREAMTYDEPVHLQYGAQVLTGDATRFDDSKMPLSAFNALPARLAAELAPGPLRSALESDLAARVPTILFSLLLGVLVLVWAERLYGPRGGLLALALFVFDPNLLAHGRLVTTDLYAALFITLALFTFQRFLALGGARRGAAAALALAVAQLAKYTAAYLYPLFLALALVRFGPHLASRLRGRRFAALGRDLGRGAAWAVVFGLTSLAVINAGFLFERTFEEVADYRFRSEQFRDLQADLAEWAPPGSALAGWLRLPVPYPYVEGMDWVLQRERTGDGYGNIYLLGETRSGRGFPGYFFVATAVKVPLATLALVLLAFVLYWQHRRGFDFLREELFLLGPVLVFTVYFNFLFQAQMGIRHFLVVFPLLYVFAGSLVADAVRPRRLPGARWTGRERTLAWAPWALAAAAGVSVVASYPHYISYFNLLVPEERAYRVLADSNLDWGQTEPVVEAFLAEHPDAIVNPPEPTAGLVVAETNWFVGVFHRKKNRWIPKDLQPDGHIAYTHLLFEIDEAELERLTTVGRSPD